MHHRALIGKAGGAGMICASAQKEFQWLLEMLLPHYGFLKGGSREPGTLGNVAAALSNFERGSPGPWRYAVDTLCDFEKWFPGKLGHVAGFCNLEKRAPDLLDVLPAPLEF